MRILVLCPHPDDEICMYGTLTKLHKLGHEIRMVVFSDCHESLPKEFKDSAVIDEFMSINEKFNTTINYILYPVRRFSEYRQDILEDLTWHKEANKPDIVYLPSSTDIHPDHNTIHNEGIRAFRQSTIYGYVMPKNNLTTDFRCFVTLTQSHIDAKLKALDGYKTQAHRLYMNHEHHLNYLRATGQLIGVEYCEQFEVIRLVQ